MSHPSLAVAALVALAPLRASEIPGGRIAELFAAWDKSDSPGCALGVIKGGKLVFARGFGMANLELGTRITPQSVFDIGSTSKQFTAACIHLLAREGRLSLDDDIRKHLPEMPDYGQPIRIRHLLHHTSGLRDYCALLAWHGFQGEDVTTDEDALRIITRQKALNFAPGEEHLYSNTGYFLLSVIVKRASGKSLRDFAREHIFEPLGMTHTQFNDSHTRLVPGRAVGHDRGPDGFAIAMSSWEQLGDGAVLTTVEDLLLWDRNFYDPKVGGRDFLNDLQAPGRLNNGKLLSYASGLMVGEHRGFRTVKHGGAWAGYRAELVRFPDQGLSVVCLCNLGDMDPSALALKVADLCLGASPKAAAQGKAAAPAIVRPVQELARLQGTWRNPRSGAVWTLVLDKDQLILEASGFRVPLVPTAADAFRTEGGPVPVSLHLEAQRDGGRARLRAGVEGEAEPRLLEPITLWSPTPEAIAEVAGTYWSPELDTTLALVMKEGRLELLHRTLGPGELKPTEVDQFSGRGLQFTVQRDARRKITGLLLDSGRVKGIRLTRQAAP